MVRAALCMSLLLLGTNASCAAELTVYADSPLQYALLKIGAAFELETGHKIAFAFVSSPDIHRRVEIGDVVDVVIVPPNFLMAMIKEGAGAVLTLRNTSVVFALVLSAALGEPPRPRQVAGALLVSLGATLVGWPR